MVREACMVKEGVCCIACVAGGVHGKGWFACRRDDH